MLTEYPVFDGNLEVRQSGRDRTIFGSFPYNRTATIRSGGRVRKERFNSGSLSWQVREFTKLQQRLSDEIATAVDDAQKAAVRARFDDELERRNTFLLTGHDYNRAIADMRSGTLAVEHSEDAVKLRATIPPEGEAPTWVDDAVKAMRGGQLRGVSPGFQVPAGRGRERLVPEDGPGDALVREIDDAVAFEYSLVARPAYSGSTADVRAESMAEPRPRWWL